VLSGAADRYLVVQFGTERRTHPNWSDWRVHKPKFEEYLAGVAGALDCASCHGATLQGQGLAIGCTTCHADPDPNDAPVVAFSTSGGVTGAPVQVALTAVDPTGGTRSAAPPASPRSRRAASRRLSGGESADCRAAPQVVSFTPALAGIYVVRGP